MRAAIYKRSTLLCLLINSSGSIIDPSLCLVAICFCGFSASDNGYCVKLIKCAMCCWKEIKMSPIMAASMIWWIPRSPRYVLTRWPICDGGTLDNPWNSNSSWPVSSSPSNTPSHRDLVSRVDGAHFIWSKCPIDYFSSLWLNKKIHIRFDLNYLKTCCPGTRVLRNFTSLIQADGKKFNQWSEVGATVKDELCFVGLSSGHLKLLCILIYVYTDKKVV